MTLKYVLIWSTFVWLASRCNLYSNFQHLAEGGVFGLSEPWVWTRPSVVSYKLITFMSLQGRGNLGNFDIMMFEDASDAQLPVC